MTQATRRWASIIGASVALTLACSGNPSQPTPPEPTTYVLVGAGDIALCSDLQGAAATASLLNGISGTVFTAGDNVYMNATDEEFQTCYASTWGRHKDRTRPSPGNHEYRVPGAAPYFAYFGAAAGPPGLGYYSFNLGSWHVVSLNSNDPGVASSQLGWLQNDLAANTLPCTVAIMHHPLYSSGPNGDTPGVRPIWQLLYQYSAEIVVNGHDHFYERFGPQNPDGHPDPSRGIRQFTVGTGGGTLYTFGAIRPNSEVRTSEWGVLKLTLTVFSYSWEFVPVSPAGLHDSGSGSCH